jgi:hypothetical protein
MELERMKVAARAWYHSGHGGAGAMQEGQYPNSMKRPLSAHPPPPVPYNHACLNDIFSYIDLDIAEESASKKPDFNGSASCNQYARSSRSSSSKRVSFKAEDEVVFSETKNIIRSAACTNDFSSSLFDSYEIKSLSNYVSSANYDVLSYDGGRHSVHGDDDVSKKWWKEFSFLYDECFPSVGMRGSSGSRSSRRHLWFNFMPIKKYGPPSLCSSTQVLFSATRSRARS